MERNSGPAVTPAQAGRLPPVWPSPRVTIVGSIGDLARLYARRTEVPEESYFASGRFRLMALIALTTDKNLVDLETVETVVAILDSSFSSAA
jgi:hypothetical protein